MTKRNTPSEHKTQGYMPAQADIAIHEAVKDFIIHPTASRYRHVENMLIDYQEAYKGSNKRSICTGNV